ADLFAGPFRAGSHPMASRDRAWDRVVRARDGMDRSGAPRASATPDRQALPQEDVVIAMAVIAVAVIAVAVIAVAVIAVAVIAAAVGLIWWSLWRRARFVRLPATTRPSER